MSDSGWWQRRRKGDSDDDRRDGERQCEGKDEDRGVSVVRQSNYK